MVFTDYLPVLAGIGMFLYGMSLMGSSLEKLAGANLEKVLEKLTSSKLKGVALGTVVTGVIQSSAATTVMVVGFLNAGIIKLPQAVPVIMGANIGTTVTAQILRLGDIGGTTIMLSLLKPSTFAPILIAAGAAIQLISKKKKTKNIAFLLLGLGLLFFGMYTMERTLSPLKDMPGFQNIFVMFRNPFLGILLGAVVTAALQSSSASVGILQALASTGAITFSNALPIILGQNIGTCLTVLLASFGTNKNSKRAVFFHLFFNLAGSAIFLVASYGYQLLIGFPFWDMPATRGNIADIHTLFNIVNTILLLPFTTLIIALARKAIPDKGLSSAEEDLAKLDDILLKSPSLALGQSLQVVMGMGHTALQNYKRAVELLYNYDDNRMQQLNDDENILDRAETALDNYVVKITSKDLTKTEGSVATGILHTVKDFERVGDYAVNIAEVAEFNHSNNIRFSADAVRELGYITSAVEEIINKTVEVYKSRRLEDAMHIEPLEEVIDVMIEKLKTRHVDRLTTGKCHVQSGISFLELLTNFERISDHCSNIAMHVIKMDESTGTIDVHAYLKKMHDATDEEYKAFFRYYESKYSDPLEAMAVQQ